MPCHISRSIIILALAFTTVACGGGHNGSGADDSDNPEDGSIKGQFVGNWSGKLRGFWNEMKHPTPVDLELQPDGRSDFTDLVENQVGGAQTYSGWSWSASGSDDGPTFDAPWVLQLWSTEASPPNSAAFKVVEIETDAFAVLQPTESGDELNVLTRAP